jgi:hypothetical protein
MRNSTRALVIGCTLAAAALVPNGSAMAAQGCHANDSLFDYTVNYPTDPRFNDVDKTGDGLLCIRNNDPHYTGDPETIKVYDNDPGLPGKNR